MPELDQRPRRDRGPRIGRRLVPGRERDRPPGRSTRRTSRNAASGSRANISPHLHSTTSTLAVSRSIHSRSIRRNSTFSIPSSRRAPARPRACSRLRRWRQEAARPDQLSREESGLPRAGRELEHSLAGLQAGVVEHPGRHRHPEFAHAVRLVCPTRRLLAPTARAFRREPRPDRRCPRTIPRPGGRSRRKRRVISSNAPSICSLRRRWKIAITASDATGPSRSTACTISGQRSAGMSACANGFQISC